MKKFLLVFAWVVGLASFSNIIQVKTLADPKAPSPCGDWKPYKEVKCLKIATHAGHQKKEDAEIVCQSLSEGLNQESYPRLMTVKTKEEQEFLQNFLFKENNIVDNVWLGLGKSVNTTEFQWSDGTSVVYSNWANQNITDDRHECVQMASGEEITAAGLWVRVTCKKANTVVCERTQTLGMEALQNWFINYKLEQEQKFSALKLSHETSEKEIGSLKQRNAASEKEIGSLKQRNAASEKEIGSLKQRNAASEKEIGSLKQRNAASEKEIGSLKQRNAASEKETEMLKRNPVPIGFIYIELPGQQPPTTLWPQTKWSEVSAKYAGQFFRVVGGGSAPFGQIQEGASPRLEQVQYAHQEVRPFESNPVNVPPDGSWSRYVYSGADDSPFLFLHFRLSKVEVRPRNQAVKVWQRTQ